MPKTSRPKGSTVAGGVEKLPMAPLAAVFGVASGDRGSLVPAELIKNNHSVGGLYLPSSMARCELFKPSLKKVLGWISSGDPKPTLGVR
ncbi:MAG: hypothetical protein M3318_02945 [Actinomycetota bacterium]|jgi:hypothetical protein|nr:hypothetical protein [Actinomycetota bacterium]